MGENGVGTYPLKIRKNDWDGELMRKLVFFDSDGTFRHGETGEVPLSAVRALKKLQAHNIGVVLCTGRHPICNIDKYDGADIFMATIISPKNNEIAFSNLDVER